VVSPSLTLLGQQSGSFELAKLLPNGAFRLAAAFGDIAHGGGGVSRDCRKNPGGVREDPHLNSGLANALGIVLQADSLDLQFLFLDGCLDQLLN